MRERTVPIGTLMGLAAMLLFASNADAQLPAPSPCCAKICNADGSSTACGALTVLDQNEPDSPDPEVVSGCLDVGPLACIGGQVLSSDESVLTEGCACALSPDICLNIGIPDGGPAQATPEECTAAAVAACENSGNVVVTPNDPDCGNGGPVCGDGVCDPGEDCPEDCDGGPVCGDGVCDPGEDCPEDCDGGPVCGNDVCEEGETAETCPDDCAGEICNNGTDDDGDGKIDCEDRDCFKNRSGGGDDTNPGGGGNPQGFCNPGGSKK